MPRQRGAGRHREARMPDSNEIRRLSAKWATASGWPQRLEWVEVTGVRGWTGQRFHLCYPIMAVVGENGVGKSSVLQAVASVYRSPKNKKARFASDFFPDTAWERITNATVSFAFRQGDKGSEKSLRKPGERWRGNPQRPERYVEYIDLSRIQPIGARVGYTKLVRSPHKEVSATLFDKLRLDRFSQIMGRTYDLARMALTDVHSKRAVPVLAQQGATYSGFHQGAGETMIAELLQVDLPQHSIVLIDEIESSLHPRAQRRLIRDLAERCREREWQVVLTTHSPYVLSELPPEARAYIMQVGTARTIIYGVSPEFAMTKMDDVAQPECDLFVEDIRAQTLLTEILVEQAPHVIQRSRIIPYGAASVGQALGLMVYQGRFPRPSRVFLDGDQATSVGCINLPGDDAPERVVFEGMRAHNWGSIHQRVGRPFANVADACGRAMVVSDHHEWVADAASKLIVSGDILWQAMCSEWARTCLAKDDAVKITQPIEDALIGLGPEALARPRSASPSVAPPAAVSVAPPVATAKAKPKSGASPSGPLPLFEL